MKKFEPPQKPVRLKVGKTYEFRMPDKTGTKLIKKATMDEGKGERLHFTAKVIKEYPRFYLMDTGNYVETLHKYAVGRDYRAKEI